MSFDIDRFVSECRALRKKADAPAQIADLLRATLTQRDAVSRAIAERKALKASSAMAEVLLNEDDLTIYQVSFPPNLYGVPHDHAGWAVIGVYSGAEAFNVYEESGGKLRRIGKEVISAPDVKILEPSLIHDIESAHDGTSGSIHVYGNRHFDMAGRRIWRSPTDPAEPFSVEKSFEYGMELTNRRRGELGIADQSIPVLPNLDAPE